MTGAADADTGAPRIPAEPSAPATHLPGDPSAAATHLPAGLPLHDAIVLAGGRARRLGGDKPNVEVGGRRLLDHVLEATVQARRVVVVGPPELVPAGHSGVGGGGTDSRGTDSGVVDGDGSDDPGGPRVLVAREDPPFGGPVAGLAAGLARLARADAPAPVLLLACDVPLAPRLVPELLAAWSQAQERADAGVSPDGICAEADGRVQWLVGVYDPAALRRAVAAIAAARPVDGASMRELMGHLAVATTHDTRGLSDDVDTWHDVERIEGRLAPDAPADPR